eukprot:scaffold35153_cov30-Phaeocystis_antarctica.AAC.1
MYASPLHEVSRSEARSLLNSMNSSMKSAKPDQSIRFHILRQGKVGEVMHGSEYGTGTALQSYTLCFTGSNGIYRLGEVLNEAVVPGLNCLVQDEHDHQR